MPNSVAIIDGTEIFIQHPSNLDTQKSMYSNYKSHTITMNLVSIYPFTGCFNYVSEGFSGNSSDRFIIEKSMRGQLLAVSHCRGSRSKSSHWYYAKTTNCTSIGVSVGGGGGGGGGGHEALLTGN